MNPIIPMSPAKSPSRKKGFTLVEIMVASFIGLLVIGAVVTISVVAGQLYAKTQMVADAAAGTRIVQEKFNSELSRAIIQTYKNTTPQAMIQPAVSDSGNDALSPSVTRYGTVIYRTSVGPTFKVDAATAQSLTSITLSAPALPLTVAQTPLVGDYVVFDAKPDIGVAGTTIVTPGIPISGVQVNSTTGKIILTLPATISSYNHAVPSDTSDVKLDAITIIERESKFETNHPVTGSTERYELWWYPQSANPTTAVVLSQNVDANNRYLFATVTDGATPPKSQGISWVFNYATDNPARLAKSIISGKATYYLVNLAEGLAMPKSGNSATSADVQPTPLTGNGTTTAGTTTAGTTTAGTTTAGTTTAIGISECATAAAIRYRCTADSGDVPCSARFSCLIVWFT